MELVAETVAWLVDGANWTGPGNIPTRLLEHLGLSGVSLLLAFAIAFPAGVVIGHTGRAANVAVNVANLARAVPSLALIGLVVPLTAALDPELGFKVYPTVIAMVVLGIPPILVNTYTGVSDVDRELVESARGMGMTGAQVLGHVELPLALPVLLAGVRSAAVQIIATATLGAVFGGGGLGRFLVEGIAQNDAGKIFGGVVLVAGLALAAEAVFAVAQRALTSPGLRVRREAWDPRLAPTARPPGA
jgi:osmoprotectant transport system permease protein